MYELGTVFDDVSVPPGTNLLVTGPAMTGKRKLAFGMLAHGSRNGEGAIVVTTKDGADRVLDEYRDLVSEGAPVGVVDCVTRQQGVDAEERQYVRYASSPVDLTGIGIELSELLKLFYQDRGLAQNRVLLYSLSTLLMYSELPTVFRFLHVFTGRLQTASGLGLFLIDESVHDQQEMSTIKQLFDGIVEIRETDGRRECRLVGIPDVDDSWRTY